ncbi:MAG: UbiA family prenyltransferase [Verrucomicrobiales bacterium]
MTKSTVTDQLTTMGRPQAGDFAALTKARLSLLVVVTSVCGYIAASRTLGTFSWGMLGHTFFGTLLCAFGAGVFNQIMEVKEDALMHRTADRPLPGRRIPVAVAFALGLVCCQGSESSIQWCNSCFRRFRRAHFGTQFFIFYTP